MPVGRYRKIKPFLLKSIQLQKDDNIYLFSDGYVDQTGGSSKRKKYSKPRFRDLLLNCFSLSMPEQERLLEND